MDKSDVFNIENFLNYAGIGHVKDGHRFIRLAEHDSLVIDRRNNKYSWNSRGTGGRLKGFIKDYYDVSWDEAGKRMKEFAADTRNQVKPRSSSWVEEPKKDYDASSHAYEPVDSGKKYLTNVRHLDPGLIDAFVDNGFIKQDAKYHNLIFAWKDKDNQVVGGDVQGTNINHEKFGKRGTFKIIDGNSLENYGFNFINGNGKDALYITESPIDLMSYYQLDAANLSKQNATFLSLSGASTKLGTINNFVGERTGMLSNAKDGVMVAKRDLEHGLNGKPGFNVDLFKEVHICVDNDDAGRKLVEKFTQISNWVGNSKETKMFVDVPVNPSVKDWNQELQENKFGKVAIPMDQLRKSVKQDISLEQAVTQARDSRINTKPKMPNLAAQQVHPQVLAQAAPQIGGMSR